MFYIRLPYFVSWKIRKERLKNTIGKGSIVMTTEKSWKLSLIYLFEQVFFIATA